MIDHTGLFVSDLAKSKKWYLSALAPIGYGVIMEFTKEITGTTDVAGFGETKLNKADFWMAEATPTLPVTHPPLHIAFRAETRAQVDKFYQMAIAAGGTDNGVPGLRPHYHPDYYGAFVFDPDGHNIEVVCHTPQ